MNGSPNSRADANTSLNRAGRPAWITDELVADTLEVWQPFYRETLTARDAIEILLSVGRLLDVLEVSDGEALSRPGSRIEP